MRAYAVTASKRLGSAPEIPTVDEAGLPGFHVSIWQGVWAPKGTPKEAIAKLNAAIAGALADPTVQKRLADIGQELPSKEQTTPEGFGAFHKAEMDKWTPIIKAAEHQAGRTDSGCSKRRSERGLRVRPSAPLIVRRIDAIPVALPLKAPMKMAGVTITKAENLLVRVELQDGQVGWGEAPSAPTMTGDTLGSLVAAVRDHLAPLLDRQGCLDGRRDSSADAAACAGRQHRRAFGGRDGAARCRLPRDETAG